MALNRAQEDQIALEFKHTLEEVRGRKIEHTAWVRFKEFEGRGNGIVLKDGCGERAYEAQRKRGEGLDFRAALCPGTANGCRTEVKEVGELFRQKLERLAASWGRKNLPVDYWGVSVNSDGVALSREYTMPPLARGG